MSALLWPGDDRAGDLMSDVDVLAAMVEVEQAWLSALVETGIAPASAKADLRGLVTADDLPAIAAAAEAGGNPVIPLVALLRDRSGSTWVHRGLTSQDVVDSALVLAARRALGRVTDQLRAQAQTLVYLVDEHRPTPMVARTLTQHAVPTTFGLKAAVWLTSVLDAYDDVAALAYPLQLGGAAGTHAALVELGGPEAARACVAETARTLGLAPSPPWHTTRTAVTRIGDAAVRCTDAWGRIAGDVLVLARPEIGELAEGAGGGSSTMPHKANPVLSTLVRRAALTTPQLAATLHLAAAQQVDERADGAWHAEWETLATLLRRTAVAGGQTSDLLAGLRVRGDRMWDTLKAARSDMLAEQRTMAALVDREPAESYLGLTDDLVDAVLARAYATLDRTHDRNDQGEHP
ncbi:lyase family protein [Nocardioides sp. LS1]|uniref:lyase family protein n=1 Tax=Nocardioides sp. LS1 TaxID=1027620 RepID=UPI000F617D97|nr:lyase family protein [Nocardioides sp. LS1]GCD89786.1 3-carboxy-cis,cis-muconate cycloisomerase [Nocardioides sp. LS1]